MEQTDDHSLMELYAPEDELAAALGRHGQMGRQTKPQREHTAATPTGRRWRSKVDRCASTRLRIWGSELLKTRDDFLTGLENDHKGALPAGLMEQFVLHGASNGQRTGQTDASSERRAESGCGLN